jgi:hypothetical protein
MRVSPRHRLETPDDGRRVGVSVGARVHLVAQLSAQVGGRCSLGGMFSRRPPGGCEGPAVQVGEKESTSARCSGGLKVRLCAREREELTSTKVQGEVRMVPPPTTTKVPFP